MVRRRRQGPELPPRVRREPRGRRDHLHGVRGDRIAARLRALPHRKPPLACAGPRALSIAGRAAAAGAGLRLHPCVLIGRAAVARQHMAARRRPCRAYAAVLPAGGGGRHAASGLTRSRGRCGVTGQQRLATLHAHRAAGAASFDRRRPDYRRGAVDRRIPVLESGRGIPQSHLSGGAVAGLLRRDRIRLRGDGDPARIGNGRCRRRRAHRRRRDANEC